MARMRPSSKVNMNERQISMGLSDMEPTYLKKNGILKFGSHMFKLGRYFRGSRMARMRPSSKVNMNERNANMGLSHTEPTY